MFFNVNFQLKVFTITKCVRRSLPLKFKVISLMTEIVPQYYSFKIKLVVSDSILFVLYLFQYYKQVSWFSSLVRCALSYFEFFYDYFHIPF